MKTKIKTTLIFLTLTFGYLNAQNVLTLPEASQRAAVRQRIGLTDIEVDYSRPSVKGRKIWGELVPVGFSVPTNDGKKKLPGKQEPT